MRTSLDPAVALAAALPLAVLPLVALSLAAPPLAAQSTVVSPAAWTTAEAPSSNAFPFGSSSQQFRYLNVHDDMAGTARQIRGFALRRGATTSTTTVPPITIVLDGWMSTAVTTGATVVAAFDNNHGADKQQVLTNRTISFPAAGTGIIPYDFSYAVPLDTPFAFGGAGPLCWEVQITSRPSAGNVTHDAALGTSSNPTMAASRFGTGCLPTGASQPFELTGGSSVDWPNGTGTLSATARSGPINAPAVFLLGTLDLAFPLPGTSSGTSGTCFLHNDILVSSSGTLSATGGNTFRIPVPLYPALGGANVFGTVLAIDLSANLFGIVSSNGINHHIIAPYGAQPGGRVYRTGGLGGTGTRGAGQTLVVQFSF